MATRAITAPLPRHAPATWPRVIASAAPVLLWSALVLAGHVVGARLVAADSRVHIGAPPVVGGFDLRLSWSIGAALALAAGAVAFGPALVERLRWRALIGAAWLAGAAWIVALAVGTGGGPDALWAPLQTKYEYLPAVSLVSNAHGFLQGFVEGAPTYPTHVGGHPPGMLMLLWLLERIGLGGPRWAAALVIGAAAVAAPAALVAMRAVAGEQLARRAALFVTLGPAAVWLGTSADALFSATFAVGVAMLAVACTSPAARHPGQRPRPARADSLAVACTSPAGSYRGQRLRPARADSLAVLAGLVLGCGLLLSYGLAPLGLVPLAVAVATRRWRLLAFAAAGTAAVLLAFAAAGFWWPSGLAATRELYGAGVAARRPYLDFLVISPAAFALALGPAAVAGLAALRGRRAWILPGAALAALLVAELSGLSKGETERIWLPFAPWLLLAGAALRAPRAWLALQLAVAIGLQVAVRTPW